MQTDHQALCYFLPQAKLSKKHMRWENFLSMFHFQIVHVDGKKNVVADALSKKPHVSIVFHGALEDMKEEYAQDEEFGRIYDQLEASDRHEHYTLKEGYLLMHGRNCVTRSKCEKILVESHCPPYAGHREIEATTKAIESFFYWSSLQNVVDAFVQGCIIFQGECRSTGGDYEPS